MNATNLTLAPPRPAIALAGSITEALAGSLASRWRRGFFRGVRLLSAGGLLSAAAYLGQQNLNKVESDQAFINAPVTPLRAPIGGQLKTERLEPGVALPAGTALFVARLRQPARLRVSA